LVEQRSIPSLITFGLDVDQSSAGVYNKLIEIYESRPNISQRIGMVRSADKAKEKIELRTGLTDAVHKVLSKSISIESIPKRDRLAMIDGFVQPVVDEFVSHFTDSGMHVPWSSDVIAERARGHIKNIILSKPFVPL
jgi:hypothetical protein